MAATARHATAARPIGRQRTAATGARTIAGATAIAKIGLPAAWLEHLIAAAAAEVHAVLASTANVVVAEFLLDVRVVVSHAVPMVRVVLPVAAGVDVVDVGVAIDVDVVVAPVHTAAPIAARCPAADARTPAPNAIPVARIAPRNVAYGGGK